MSFNPDPSKWAFLPNVIEWNKLNPNLRSAANFSVFNRNLLKFIRPSPNSVFNCHNCKGIKFLTRQRFGLLCERKFKHNFREALNPFCLCTFDIETNMHFFLHWPLFSNQRYNLLNTVNDINSSLINITESNLTHILLFKACKAI